MTRPMPRCARFRAEPGIERVVAEPGVHPVEIRDRVAVVRAARLVALEHRVEPELREAHAREVVESGAQSLEVAAVASVRVARGSPSPRDPGRCRLTGRRSRSGPPSRGRSRPRARSRAARRSQARAPAGIFRVSSVRPSRRKSISKAAGCRTGRDEQVDEQVVRVCGADDAAQRDARVGDGRLECRDALAVHEELQPRILHARPPVRGLDAFDLRGGRDGRGRCEAEQERKQPRLTWHFSR